MALKICPVYCSLANETKIKYFLLRGIERKVKYYWFILKKFYCRGQNML